MSVQVVPAEKAQQPVLARLLELYIHDFSELQDVDLQADGTFGYPNLPLYWLDPDRRPFFIFLDNKLAGFILIQRASEISSSPGVWDVAEFFVLRRYRRQGIGADAAHCIWTRLPGPWEVRVNESIPPRSISGSTRSPRSPTSPQPCDPFSAAAASVIISPSSRRERSEA